MKTASDAVLTRFDPAISQGGQLFQTAFASDNCPQNLHAGDPGNITDDVRQLDIHLAQRFLHTVERLGLIPNPVGSLSYQ
ncbi:hypothetical protein D3C75_1241390 [compost metagenome]